MAKNKQNQELSVINSEDRTSDGNLLPHARERAFGFIQKHIRRTGQLNISNIASKLCVSRQTAKKLIYEVMEEWRDEIEDQTLAQMKWHEFIAEEIDKHPEKFGKDEIKIIKLKSTFLGKINSLQRLLEKNYSPPKKIINVFLTKNEKQQIEKPEIESPDTD